ncbi:hypothetical protein PCANC_22088 [Puccinia coronata f. sp. avenae]|uniref:SGNH hydrolase-type esterase domain-containing protein n=1 Tax=Puccinia coronata f. sp. avenae TaxID=200324 RepID=A0A2N5TEK0_9BASI|nr:hypothetical protein PCANC_22088 [Puccinia coronata f. sp. avenae]PLW23920.1 hypothetical protein PCASD_14154 [Puccinia coronata f. sp. avenae]
MRTQLVSLHTLLAFCLALNSSCRSTIYRKRIWRRQIKLAVQPECGRLSSSDFANFNSGIDLTQIQTIYSFGDSWTSNGKFDGSPAIPAVAQGNNPMYGRRASNGPMWTEHLTSSQQVLKNYAVGGATVDHNLWKARANKSDMVGQVDKFLSQGQSINSASLATIFYGINDYAALQEGPGSLEEAAKELLKQTERLISVGLTHFIVLTPYFNRPDINNFNKLIWNGFKYLNQSRGIKFAYVDLSALFTAIYANPSSFGYKSTGACLKSALTTQGGCNDPDDYLYWIPSHPQYQTHRLIADWVSA